MAQRITDILTTLENVTAAQRPVVPWICRDGWEVYRADRRALRERAWRLAYQAYLSKGYTETRADQLRILPQDALPEASTYLVECRPAEALPLATLSLLPDSPLGLPIDADCGREMTQLRARGLKACEVVKLACNTADARFETLGRQALLHLFRLVYLQARHLEGADYLVASVTPSHARFYQKVLLFKPMGAARSYGSVRGAAGVPLWLDLRTAEEDYFKKYGHRKGEANLYRLFVNNRDGEIIDWMRATGQRMTPGELHDYFGDLAERLPSEQRDYLRRCYPEWTFAPMLQRVG